MDTDQAVLAMLKTSYYPASAASSSIVANEIRRSLPKKLDKVHDVLASRELLNIATLQNANLERPAIS